MIYDITDLLKVPRDSCMQFARIIRAWRHQSSKFSQQNSDTFEIISTHTEINVQDLIAHNRSVA